MQTQIPRCPCHCGHLHRWHHANIHRILARQIRQTDDSLDFCVYIHEHVHPLLLRNFRVAIDLYACRVGVCPVHLLLRTARSSVGIPPEKVAGTFDKCVPVRVHCFGARDGRSSVLPTQLAKVDHMHDSSHDSRHLAFLLYPRLTAMVAQQRSNDGGCSSAPPRCIRES